MPFLSAQEVARRLGVNAQRVRALASQGRLPAHKLANRWLFDSELLQDHEARARSDGRPFAQDHALGLLYIASGEDPKWLADYDKWRLRRYLPRLKEIVPRLRARAESRYFRAPPSLMRRIASDGNLVRSGVSAADHYEADISARGVIEVYCVGAYARQLEHRYALRAAPEAAANMIIHRVSRSDALAGRRVMPIAVVACDLLDSTDARTRRAGVALLRRLGRR